MSTNDDKRRTAVDGLVDALMHYLDEAAPSELEAFVGGRAKASEAVSAARAAVARAKSEVAQERRDRSREGLRSLSFRPERDVSTLSVEDLRAIFEAHVANDDASATMAARHEKGEMDEAELRSVVADILRLRDEE